MTNTFYFEDGMDNLFDEHGERVYDPMEGALTEITDPPWLFAPQYTTYSRISMACPLQHSPLEATTYAS